MLIPSLPARECNGNALVYHLHSTEKNICKWICLERNKDVKTMRQTMRRRKMYKHIEN